jgi:AcrR family transcriptional regulator
MAQVKKTAVREAILASAQHLFTRKDYSSTTLAEIARLSGVTVSNIYNYFDSKLDILYAIYEPWLLARLDRLHDEVHRVREPRAKLRHVFLTVLSDIPSEDGNFAINVLQAISTRRSNEAYSQDLLLQSEAKVSAMLAEILASTGVDANRPELLSHLLFMTFDGFTVSHHLVGASQRVEDIVDMLCDLVLGPEPQRLATASG